MRNKLEDQVVELLRRVVQESSSEMPEGATDAQLDAFESRNGLLIPPKVRSWLRQCSGVIIGPELFGVGCSEFLDVDHILNIFRGWKGRGWIPVAGDGCGNYYIVPTRDEFGAGEPVVFVDTMRDKGRPDYIVASDIWHFLYFLLRRELGESQWPFDDQEVLACDPNISKFKGVCLPWTADDDGAT